MASTFSDLGIELMSTGENAGTWGDKTNTNLQIVEKAIAGYVEVAVTSGGTKALTITDGTTTESDSVARHAVIKLTGTISGNSIVTVPDSIEKVYIVTNGTSGGFTVQFKTASGSGITFGTSEKTTRLVYSDGTNLVDAGFGGSLDVEGRELVLDADGDTSITADTDDQIDIKIAGADDFQFTANTFTAQSGSTIAAQALTATTVTASSTVQGTTITATTAFVPDASDGAALGTSSLEFSDLFLADGAVVNFGDDQDVSLTHVADTGLLLSSGDQLQFGDAGENISGDGTDLTLSSSNNMTLDAAAILVLDGGNQIFLSDDGTNYGSLAYDTSNFKIVSQVSDKGMVLRGNDGGSFLNALSIDFANAGKATFNSDVVVGGDLTVSGDDITMGTNTAGNLLVADGTNFNSIAVSSLSEISTAAADDVFIAIDTSGGGLKRIARSAVVAGLATDSAISNVVDDTTPQLGGNLDMNGADIVTTSNATIDLAPNGTGTVVVRGNTNSGRIVYNCESNSHGQTLASQPHSAAVTNTMLLPAGANSTLVSLVSTDTLTNKTLTSPKVNEDVAVTSTATELNILDGATVVVGEINALDLGATAVGTAIASKAVILDANKDYTGFRNITLSGELDAGSLDVSGNADIDGTLETDALSINGTAVTSTAAELNLLDGVSGLVQADLTKLAAVDSTAAELNIVDGGTSATGTTLVDADRLVANDAGTMVQVAMSDVKTYLSSAGFSTDDPTALAIALG